MVTQKPNLSVVVPSFGCAGTITELVERLLALENVLGSIEIIIVDDESKDGSWQIVERLSREYQNVIVIRLPRNRGQHYATALGINRSSGEYVVTIDCDLEFEPEDIAEMMANLNDSTDCVIAKSATIRDRRPIRRFFRYLYHRIMSSITRSDVLSSELLAYSFLVAKGNAIRNIFRGFPMSDPVSTKLISSDLSLTTHPVIRKNRQQRPSGYTVSENLQIVIRSILSSGRGGEMYATRLTIFLAVSSFFVSTIWLLLGTFQRESGIRDLTFLFVLMLLTLFTISSVLIFTLHIMTSVLTELRLLRQSDVDGDHEHLNSENS